MGCGIACKPLWARAMIPGRARNSTHTPAAIAPNSEKRNRFREKPSDAAWRSSAIDSDTTAPSIQPARPDSTVAASERRTPSTRPISDPDTSENANAGTRSQRSPPSRSKTDAASTVMKRTGIELPDLLNGQRAIGVLRAQHLLVELPDARLRDLGDERPSLRKLPTRDALAQERVQLLRSHLRARRPYDARERTFVPARIRNRDHCRFRDIGMRHQLPFELHRRDPLAARLDDILGAVGDADVPVVRDTRDVAGTQPTMVELLGRGIAVVRRGDPRTPHLDLAHRLPVPGQHGAVVGDDAQLDTWQHATGDRAPVEVFRGSRLDAA